MERTPYPAAKPQKKTIAIEMAAGAILPAPNIKQYENIDEASAH